MMRRRIRQPRQGVPVRVQDEDTLEGWPPRTVFMTCNPRSELWHLAGQQAFGAIVMPKLTACGVRPYQAAGCRRDWIGFDVVLVCASCRSIAADF